MTVLLNLIDRLSRFAELSAVLLIFGYCILMLTEVVARAQAQSFSFTWEYSTYAMAAIFALASGPAIRTAVHVRITLVTELMPARMTKWLDVLANGVALLIVAAIVWAMWVKTSGSYDRNILATSVSKTPLWIPQALVLWGGAQLWLDLLARMIRRARDETYEWRNADKEHVDV
ncbi:TRAP transporter small permease subunit [Yoonia sediminilitoris]|uniref:TRAP transporter small permease protein n=1 Tax=Yoonia sediminilitoris TaxID=1286148 RepID=A0A2T6KBT4_9RHOB|nr:TRAP transporter small permease [Yoonia sediminilitoris]PUB12374.1 TRAP-type mannitol/chloroaromatic compound transport system permease small subunit [Yoonia sediminilitoris]RCW93068.1 TRAP-type mannitol/chloroaromatic compound transport system permease small subunit [Yoonia sediminilitoris]